jgi:EF hand
MHRFIERWLTSALLAGFVLAGASQAQPPGQKDGPPKGPAQPAPISVDDIIERIMAFDKNKDGQVTRDELPERMHHLIELGDTNKDGALDKDEIRKLATKLAATPAGFGGGFGEGGPVRVGVGPDSGPGVPGGFRTGGAIRSGPDVVEGVVDDLKLSGKKKEQAMAAAKAHQENVRKLMDQARAELLEKMKEILSEEEFKDFRAALDRPRGVTFFGVGPGDAPRGGGQKKLDPPQK